MTDADLERYAGLEDSQIDFLQTLGYPLILDSVQISSDPMRPGMIKLNLTIIILDFEQWKSEETRNA